MTGQDFQSFGRSALATRVLAALTIVFASLCCSCSKPAPVGVPFVEDGKWRPAELSGLGQLPKPLGQVGFPHFRAVWTNGSTLHVCLRFPDILPTSISIGWEIFVFSEDGWLIEQNAALGGSADQIPRRLLSVVPFRIGFGPRDATNVVKIGELHYPVGTWQRRLTDQAFESDRLWVRTYFEGWPPRPGSSEWQSKARR